MGWVLKNIQFLDFEESGFLEKIFCDKKTCINYKNGYCYLKNPEKVGTDCLEYKDALDFLRLKADAVRGTLG